MSDQPLVSVIVPSYCHEAYVLDCIQSIHAQTHGPVELVLVDDASKDATFERAEKLLTSAYGRRFDNLVLLRNESNLGAHATINRGIAASSGTHVAVINSDDLFAPDRLARMLDAMRDAGSEIAFSLVDVFESSRQPGTESSEFPHQFLLFPLRQKMAILRDPTVGFSLLRGNVAVSTGNFLFTRSLYDRVGPFLSLKYCHDWDFILQACYYTEPVPVMEPLYRYRLHRNNSFQGLAHLAGVESEVVFRRFMRRGLAGASPNPKFPNAENWPGYFEIFLKQIDKLQFLEREDGAGAPGWRIYNK